MKKLTFFTLALIILFSAHQVSAVSDKANDKAKNNPSFEKRNENSNNNQENEEENNETENENEEETTTNSEWKNHGQYVSSVAKTHPGGQVVSEAARSDIGKKNAEDDLDDLEPSVSPSVSPSASPSPSISLSPSPSEDPEASPSPTLTDTPTPTPDEEENQTVESILSAIEELINTLKSLLNL